MAKITVNTDTVNNTIPTIILLDKATTNNSLDEEEDSTVEVEESAMKRLDVNLQ